MTQLVLLTIETNCVLIDLSFATLADHSTLFHPLKFNLKTDLMNEMRLKNSNLLQLEMCLRAIL